MGAHVSVRLAPCSRTGRRPARGSLTRIFEPTVQGFYARRAREEGRLGAKTGSVTVLQRVSSDLRLNPHIHSVFLAPGTSACRRTIFVGLGHLGTSEVGAVLEHTIRRMEKYLRRRGVLPGNEDDDLHFHADPETGLAAAAVSGQVPPAQPQWAVRLRPPERRGLAYDKPRCASMDGFTLHAATRAGALDASGREALLRYVLRPPIAQDWVEQARRAWSASSSRDPSPTGPSRWRWIRCRYRVVSPRVSLRRVTTPSGTPASSQQRANGDRASCRQRTKRSHLSGPEGRGAGADTAPGRTCSRARRAGLARLPRLPGAHEARRRPQEPSTESHATSPRSVSRPSCHDARPAGARPIGRAASCAGWPRDTTTTPERLRRHAPSDAPKSLIASPGPGEGLPPGPYSLHRRLSRILSRTALAPASAPDGTSRRRGRRSKGACVAYARQVTRNGGSYAQESGDGRDVYFYKGFRDGTVWRLPVEGGEEAEVLRGPDAWDGWTLSENGIYFSTWKWKVRWRSVEYAIQYFDLGSGQVTEIFRTQGSFLPGRLAVSPDERSILHAEAPLVKSELMLVENFR